MRKLKPFGAGGTAIDNGDLGLHVGWIEALKDDEADNIGDHFLTRSPRVKRLELVEAALDKLNEALDYEAE